MKAIILITLFFFSIFTSPVNAADTFTCKVVAESATTFKCVPDASACNGTTTFDNCSMRPPTTAGCQNVPATACLANAPDSNLPSDLRCDSNKGINTAIGCIPVFTTGDTRPFAEFILGWGVGIAGGIGMLLILYAGFLIMTSSGNPQQVQSGKELMGAAISAILLLIFSAFILRFVGVDILGIFT